MNDDTISRRAAIDALEKKQISGSTLYYTGIRIALKEIKALPSAQPEHMHTVMLKIKEKYEKAMNTPCINNKIAWALYQTWKEYDR